MSDQQITYAQLLETNNLIQQNADEFLFLCTTRTVQESKLFPVSAYILFSYLNAFYRWPTLLRKIEKTMSAEEIGDRSRYQSIKIVSTCMPNFYLLGREMLINWGVLRPEDAIEDVIYVMDFWKRFQLARNRNNSYLMNVQGGRRAQVMEEQQLQVFHADAFECRDGDPLHAAAQSFLATAAQYGFLVSCESRLTTQNHGPYKIAGNREMLVRELVDLSECGLPWLDGVAEDIPYNNLTVSMIVEDCHIKLLDDWGSYESEPELKPEHLVAVGLYTSDSLSGGYLPVGMSSKEELTGTFLDLADKIKTATHDLWREMIGWTRDQQLDAGALTYYSIIKEFAHIAGVYDNDEWMKIDERADRFRSLLNDEYGNLYLGELVAMLTLPSQRFHQYRMNRYSNTASRGLTLIPYSVLEDGEYTASCGPLKPGRSSLPEKNDRFRTSQGVLSIDEYNRRSGEASPLACREGYRFLCDTWVKYNAGTPQADALFKAVQQHSRLLKNKGAMLSRDQVEQLRCTE